VVDCFALAPHYPRVQVVLLAAGLGSRLGTLTTLVPKALIEVGGQPLVLHALGFAARLGPSRVIVVGGFGFAQLATLVERAWAQGGQAATLVENPRFRDGNLLSLMAARPSIDHGDGDGFLLLNVDHIYRPGVAEVIRPPATEVTAFVDTDRLLGADDMKVERDAGGRVRRIAKTLTRFDAGYVGITRVPHPELPRYFAAADAVLAADGPVTHVERVLARLGESELPPSCRDISGHGWLEVDTPDERAAAEEALRGPGWR
jgi:L-glutamine-phosphate cytidylyltransferase